MHIHTQTHCIQRESEQVNRVLKRDAIGIWMVLWMEFIRVSSNKWSKNQDLCTFIIKFSQLVRLFFVIFFQMKMQLFCSANDSLGIIRCMCDVIAVATILPLPWHLHFDCFVVLYFFFCLYLHFSFTRIRPFKSCHQDKYSYSVFLSHTFFPFRFTQSAHSALNLTVHFSLFAFVHLVFIYIFELLSVGSRGDKLSGSVKIH